MAREVVNRLAWSYSRHGLFHDCPRGYYYHYYGSWGGWSAEADEDARRLYLLKQLKSRHLWVGSIVHEAAAQALAAVRAGAEPATGPRAQDAAEAAAQAVVTRMRREFRASRSGEYRSDPRRVTGLREHHYGEAVADAEWRDLAEQARRCVRFFFRDPLPRLRAVARADWLALEDLELFSLGDLPVYVKMDFACRTPDGGLLIIDWKTGRRGPSGDGLQLAVYALHAAARWKAAPEAIVVREVNLNVGEEESVRATAEQLERAGEAIRESFARMRACLVDPEANLARSEDFSPRPSARGCGGCNFREICPEHAGSRASFDRPGASRSIRSWTG